MKNPASDRARRLLPFFLLAGLASPASTLSARVNVWTTSGPYGADIRALAINPANSATLYAGTYGGGVFKSTDGGVSWTAVNTGLTNARVNALAIDPSAPDTLYAGTSYSGAQDVGVYKSTNGGGTWKLILYVGGVTEVTALAIDPSAPANIYASFSTELSIGVSKSIDGGAHWTDSFFSSGVTVSALAIDPLAPAALYAGTDRGLFRSTDHGGSWIEVNMGLINTSVSALAIDRGGAWDYGSTLYAGTSGGVYRNDGVTWTAINTGLTNTVVQALAIDLSIHPSGAGPDAVYAGTPGGVFRIAINGGGSWTATNAGLTSTDVRVLAIDPTNPATVYAGTAGAGVFKRTDSAAGATWLLPSSAHASGANGAFYTTNLAVANLGAESTAFTMKFLGHDQDGSVGPEQTFTLDAGKSVTYFDVLGAVFSEASSFGAIRITSGVSTLNIASVTSTPGFGGTLSQTISAVRSSDLIPANSSRSILYIREGDGFRSNLVLASDADVSTMVDATLVSPAGATLATKSYSVPAHGMTQISRVVRDMGVSGPVTGARLRLFSSTPGAAFTGFASIIDEMTNDPTAVEAR